MQTLEGFKQGTIDALVATDVAARGLDIVDMPCVINFDLPFSAEDYVHRIGRTGRAGATGDALSVFVPSEERLLADIEKLLKRSIPRATLEGFDPTGYKGREGREGREGGRGDDVDRRRPRADARRPRGEGEERPRKSEYTPARGGAFRPSDDPFFSRPYEPGNGAGGANGNAQGEQNGADANAVGFGRARPVSKRPLAALLGGGARKG
jgi:superfamily II DNA/RNA helicase